MTHTNWGICNTGNGLKKVVLRKSAIKNKLNINVISVQKVRFKVLYAMLVQFLLLSYFLHSKPGCNCCTSSRSEERSCRIEGCRVSLHILLVTGQFQGEEVLYRAFKVWLACSQPCTTNYVIFFLDKLLDDSKRPTVPVALSRLDDDHVSNRKGTLLVTVFETMALT